MNLLLQAMMEAPDVLPPWCVICGIPADDPHHPVPRSAGGEEGPRLRLCGSGNASGHHGAAHAYKLHFRYVRNAWEYLETDQAMKYERALEATGWRRLP